jgi:hypothetical protein
MLEVGSWIAGPVAGTIHVDKGWMLLRSRCLRLETLIETFLIRPSCRMPQQIICRIWMRVISKALR